jgi:hypothetical protein
MARRNASLEALELSLSRESGRIGDPSLGAMQLDDSKSGLKLGEVQRSDNEGGLIPRLSSTASASERNSDTTWSVTLIGMSNRLAMLKAHSSTKPLVRAARAESA